MTNNEIIFENVRASFTPAQLAELVQATYTAEQIAARRANITITVDEGSADTAEDIFTAMLAADQFHTFAEWKRMGYSVKKGAKSAITCHSGISSANRSSASSASRKPSSDSAPHMSAPNARQHSSASCSQERRCNSGASARIHIRICGHSKWIPDSAA